MNNKLRSVNTKIWDDPFIEDLPPEEKLLFIYFLTNPLTNILGVYEISIRRMSYDTGLEKETVIKALEGFETIGKVAYFESYLILPNFLKNQKLNANMKVGALNAYNSLPSSIKNEIDTNASKPFETLRNAMLKMKEKMKEEIEVEDIESRRNKFEQEVMLNTLKYPEEMLEEFIKYWSEQTKSGKKMRWELQPTWQLSGRLATWFKRSKFTQGKAPGKNNDSDFS